MDRRQQLREEFDAIRMAEGVLRARAAWLWAEQRPQSALYREIEQRGFWDDPTAAAAGRDQCVRQILREVYLVPVNPEAAEPDRRAVQVRPYDPDKLVSDYLPSSRSPDGGATGGYIPLQDIHDDADMRARQRARFRWESEMLWERYAALGLKEVDDLIVSMADLAGFDRPQRLQGAASFPLDKLARAGVGSSA